MPEVGSARAPSRLWLSLLLIVIAGWWGANSTGLVSSNDGSHTALARAFARGELRIDSDVDLTLGVDLARTDAGFYSDRPPGTALVAVPALAVGASADASLGALSRERGELLLAPAAPPYILTHHRRFDAATPLVDRVGTGTAAAVHGMLMGLLGVLAFIGLLRARGATTSEIAFATGVLALGSSYGAYATTLFSHVSAATWMLCCALACEHARRRADSTTTIATTTIAKWTPALAAGAAGAMAVACDYLLVLAVVPLVALATPPRTWPGVLVGAVPVAAALALYHDHAFGSALSVGYDHHVNFEFARSRADTFSGDALHGAWTLFGGGNGGGLLALSPLLWLGAIVAATKPRHRTTVIAWAPWAIALCLHVTPAGGVGDDHRYLIPALPFAAAGLAPIWGHVGRGGRVVLIAAAIVGGYTTWTHFVGWHETALASSPLVGAALALGTALIAATVAFSSPQRTAAAAVE